jgi:tricorn protease-like protein
LKHVQKNQFRGKSVKAYRSGSMIGKTVLILTILWAGVASAVEEKPLLRFPDIHGDTVVFVYGEDIWSAPVSGGIAQRLTIHDGQERFLDSRQTATGLLSRRNMTVIKMCMSWDCTAVTSSA